LFRTKNILLGIPPISYRVLFENFSNCPQEEQNAQMRFVIYFSFSNLESLKFVTKRPRENPKSFCAAFFAGFRP
ncbi:hypothetical protein, partial [Anaerotruncus massiliensis (ex Togo et al. 2019)]|uniref:hypothetical protein n=1 Tax=Anaerotruncus massiliensis (ex Togo et al. 2019) TaxID=1673720 RepID=UPI0023F19EC1